MLARILIADDESASRSALVELLTRWGHEVQEAQDGSEALRYAMEQHPDLVITDLVMPNMDGLWLLRSLREELGEVPVVLLTGRGTIDSAVEAIREGAYDFLEKPVDLSRLRVIVNRAVEKMATLQEVAALRHSLRQQQRGGGGGIIGVSQSMRQVYSLVEKVAPSKTSVVITGPSGSGKEIMAQAIHDLSPRKEKPFIAINCSAIPASLMESEIFGHEKGAFTGAEQRRLGCFELAHGGTLFLDEVGELPVELQAKFLRVIEEEKLRRVGGKTEVSVDVRVICATNRDLKEQIEKGEFREDLYFRLNVFTIELPPLRDRKEDVPLLVQHFVERFASEGGKRIDGVTQGALEVLQSYPWPGNIRELRNTIERATILCDGGMIDESHLPPEMAATPMKGSVIKLSLGMPLREVEKEYILGSLRRNKGNKSRTAEVLGISEKTLYNKLNRYVSDASAEPRNTMRALEEPSPRSPAR